MIGNCSFKLDHYKECLLAAKQKGYIFLTFEEYMRRKKELVKERVILMRHDIDHKLFLLENFSQIEQSLDIRATYFIRLHAAGYNTYGFENYTIIKNLLQMKHEVGLHHDAGFAKLFGEDPEHFFERDKEVFENMLGKKISGISCHEPNNSKDEFMVSDENVARFGLAYHAYSPIFLQEMKYISDSSARWREGCMCNFIEKGVQKLCILTHPLWWHRRSPLENY